MSIKQQFNGLIDQLQYAVNRAQGKTTITQSDIDLMIKAYLAIPNATVIEPTKFALFANGQLDQICDSEQEARQEARDLKHMDIDGLRIYSVKGISYQEAIDEIDELIRQNKPFGRKGYARLKEKYGVTIEIIYSGRY